MERRFLMKYLIYPLSLTNHNWESIPVAFVEHFPWKTSEYYPKTKAQLAYSKEGIHVRLESYESQIVALYERLNDPVCKDSCMEFFFNPNPDHDDRYLNFEMNPIGTLHVGLGIGRHDRRHLDEVDPSVFQIKTSVTKESLKDYQGPSWVLEYMIPFAWLEQYYGSISFGEGHRMKGNFYKCGDKTVHPHFGCWNPVENLTPDFHRPEFFGELIFHS